MTIRELTSAPKLATLFARAVLTGFTRGGGALPDTVYELPRVAVDPEHLAAYNRVCGFRMTGELSATYPHVLSFPLQLKLMTDPGFPFPLAGSVHLANRISVTRTLRLDEKLTLRVHAENQRDHPKGRRFDMISKALVGGEVVWTDVSTYLRRGGGTEGRLQVPPGRTEGGFQVLGGTEGGLQVSARSEGGLQDIDEGSAHKRREPPEPTAIWRVPGDTGRRYAQVSGDRNPIHLHPLTARLFGFPRAIAHGMWTKARCLAAFEGRLPDEYTVDVRFQLPVLLPARVGFATHREDGGRRFQLFDARTGKPHVDGAISPPL